jgi:hypothetical protein
MGFDLYVISHDDYYRFHKHSDDEDSYDEDSYDENEEAYRNFLRDESRNDPWYRDDKFPNYHRIWKNWLSGKYEHNDGTSPSFPLELHGFYFCMNLKHVVDDLAKLDSNEILDFVEWARHWISKGARFEASY